MTYDFDGDLAKRYGVAEAVMLQIFVRLIYHDDTIDKYFREDKAWGKISIASIQRYTPFWSTKQISRVLRSLHYQKALHINVLNQRATDRTKWYSVAKGII